MRLRMPWRRRAETAAPSPVAVKASPRPWWRGIASVIEGLGGRSPTAPNGGWVIPQPAPGVLPVGRKIAMDAAPGGIGQVYQWAAGAAGHEAMAFLGFPNLALMAQRAEYHNPASIIAGECTRKWIEFTARAGDDKADRLAKVEEAFSRLHVRSAIKRMVELDATMGRAHLYIDTGLGGADDEALATPLLLERETLPLGALKGVRVVDPTWVYPNRYNSTQPLRDDFYRPETWFVMGQEVHRTRLLTLVAHELPDMLKPAYAFGGLSLSQMAKPYVDNWLRTRQSVSDLLHSFTVWVLKTDIGQFLSSGAATALVQRLELFNRTRDNRGVFVVDKDREDFGNVSATVAGLDKLQAQAQEQQASVTRIPLVKLMGITPTGLNASSDGEIRAFYDTIAEIQQDKLRPIITAVMHCVMLSELGEIDPDIDFTFVPLWQLDAAAQATVRKTEIDADVELIQAGVISPSEARQRIAADKESGYNALDVDETPVPPDDGADLE